MYSDDGVNVYVETTSVDDDVGDDDQSVSSEIWVMSVVKTTTLDPRPYPLARV